MRFSALFYLSARMHLIIQRMILLLLPSMRVLASILMFASISIGLNEVLCFPLGTLFLFIVKDMRFTSEILPIMSINARIPGMISITVWTPDCFEMKHVEISVLLELIQQVNSDFIFRVSESTHVSIVARLYLIGI